MNLTFPHTSTALTEHLNIYGCNYNISNVFDSVLHPEKNDNLCDRKCVT